MSGSWSQTYWSSSFHHWGLTLLVVCLCVGMCLSLVWRLSCHFLLIGVIPCSSSCCRILACQMAVVMFACLLVFLLRVGAVNVGMSCKYLLIFLLMHLSGVIGFTLLLLPQSFICSSVSMSLICSVFWRAACQSLCPGIDMYCLFPAGRHKFVAFMFVLDKARQHFKVEFITDYMIPDCSN